MSSDFTSTTTELEAVNEVLSVISEAPVSSLSGDLPLDARLALDRLRSTSRRIQTKRWAFNTDENVQLLPNLSGEIALAPNVLAADFPLEPDLVVREGKVYNTRQQTFQINKTVIANVTLVLPFESLPEYVRAFVVIKTARFFQDRVLSDSTLHTFTKRDEAEAWAAFLDEEATLGNYNILDHSPVVSNILKLRRPSPR